MSAPQTDPERQAERHKFPLVVMALVCVLVLGAFVWWLGYETSPPAASPEVERQQEANPDAVREVAPQPGPIAPAP